MKIPSLKRGAFAPAWRLPTLPGPCGPSTIGAGGLNGRVRDGYAWDPSAIDTKRIISTNDREVSQEAYSTSNLESALEVRCSCRFAYTPLLLLRSNSTFS